MSLKLFQYSWHFTIKQGYFKFAFSLEISQRNTPGGLRYTGKRKAADLTERLLTCERKDALGIQHALRRL